MQRGQATKCTSIGWKAQKEQGKCIDLSQFLRVRRVARALTKRRVQIGTRQVPCPGTVPGHQG